MSDGVMGRVVSAIRARGPISFAEYMEIALYGPDGYYARPPIGADRDRDFVTSPHVHPVFGELLAAGLRDLWHLLGAPAPFRIVEVGAGDGTLARQLLGSLEDVDVAMTAVEISPGARDALGAIDDLEVREDLPGAADVVLAHELLDNLPFRVLRGDREVRVDIDDDAGTLVERLVPADDELLAIAGGGERDEVVVPVGARAFVDRIAPMLDPGYALLIDYAAAGGPAGTAVHGYREHGVIDDVLAAPGATDVTAGVDLGMVTARARELGLTTFGPVTQHRALVALGLGAWLQGELDRQHRSLDARDGLEAVRTWTGRSRASLLADPAGLGRLRWLLLSSPGLAAPDWIAVDQPD